MADEIDRAQDAADANLADQLANHAAQAAAVVRPVARGYCLYVRCGEEFAANDRLFCGAECAAAHARISRK